MRTWLFDLRVALRTLRRDRLFGLVSAGTLSVAIASSTAMFALVNTVLLQPLPFPDETRLLRIRNADTAGGGRVLFNVPGVQAAFLREQRHIFDAVADMSGEGRLLRAADGAVRVSLARIDSGWPQTIGVGPIVGRFFSPDEFAAGDASGVAIVSHGLWRDRLGGGPLEDRTIEFGTRRYRVVGVFPRGFHFPYVADVWVPGTPAEIGQGAAFARMTGGVELAGARERAAALVPAMRANFPQLGAHVALDLDAARHSLIESEDRTTMALLAVAGGFLLLACANVASLFIARTSARRSELALRAALGAGRLRQYRSLIAETVVLSLASGAIGFLLADWLLQPLGSLLPANWTEELRFDGVRTDWRVALFATAMAVVIGCAIAALAWRRNRDVSPSILLASGSRGNTAAAMPMQTLLVAGQLALTLTVLAGMGLLVVHARSLATAPLGLDAARVLTLRLQFPEVGYEAPERRADLLRRVVTAVRQGPGVEDAAIITANPLSDFTATTRYEVDGRAHLAGDALPEVNHRLVTPGFMHTLGISLRRGRGFAEADNAAAPRVAIVSEYMARTAWPGADPVGQRLRPAAAGAPWITVVGVAADVRDSGEVRPTWYLPYAQHAGTPGARFVHVAVRTAGDPAAVARAVVHDIAGVEPDAGVFDVTPMAQVYGATIERERVAARVALLFGTLALLLSTVGVYGAIALFVGGRRLEFGIRSALGADAAGITRLVLGRAGTMVATGLAAGLAGAYVMGRLLQGLLPGLSASRPAVTLAVAALLAAVSLIAAYLPARRAGRVAPSVVLRGE